MGTGYAPLIGRGLRLAHRPTTLVFEIMYSSYSIFFEQAALDDGTGVEFYPAFLPKHPTDVNYYSKQDTDYTRLQNVAPAAPPGGFLAFGRLSGKMAVKPDRRSGFLTTELEDHPVVRGDRLFEASILSPKTKVAGAMQEGGIGFLVFRPDYDTFGMQIERLGNASGTSLPAGGQLTQFYFRCAFGPEALEAVDVQEVIIREAIRFAVGNSPKDGYGTPFVSVVHCTGPILVPSVPQVAQGVFEAGSVVNAANVAEVTRWLLSSAICRENKSVGWEAAVQAAALYYELGVYLDSGAEHTDFEEISVELSSATGGGAVVRDTCQETARTIMHSTEQKFFTREEALSVYELYKTSLAEARARATASHCSPVLYYTAPPDQEKFSGKPLVVVGVLLAIRLGVTKAVGDMSAFDKRLARRTAGDLGTRFMCDAMLFNPVLAVTPCTSECMLSLFTDKAPGLLNVRSACRGMPIKATSTSDHRRITNAHPAIPGVEIFTTKHNVGRLPVSVVPDMSREQADRNPLLRSLVRGGKTPYAVPGVEASIYDASHTCQTIVAGTRHSWPVKGAILYKRIMTPRSKEFPLGFFDDSVGDLERSEALQFLFPPDYNSAACQIYSETGAWSLPGTTHRRWKKPNHDRQCLHIFCPKEHLYRFTISLYQALKRTIWLRREKHFAPRTTAIA